MKKIIVSVICVIPAILSLTTVSSSSDIIYSCQSSKKNIALTFDDGPHPVHTPEILDVLAEYGIKATFFVIGENVG